MGKKTRGENYSISTKARILKYSTLFSRWLCCLFVMRLDLIRLVCDSQLPTSATELLGLRIPVIHTTYVLLQYWEHRNSETGYSKLINTVTTHHGQPCMVVHACNSCTQKLQQEDHKFKANPGYVRRSCLQGKGGIEGYGDESVSEVLAMQP